MADSVIFNACEHPTMLNWSGVHIAEDGAVPIAHAAVARKRGEMGLHIGPVNTPSIKHSYAYHNTTVRAVAAGQAVYLAGWVNLVAGTVLKGEVLLEWRNSAGSAVAALTGKVNAAGGVLIATAMNDTGSGHSATQTATLNGTGWHWIVVKVVRATAANNDGTVQLFVDGVATGNPVTIFSGGPPKSNNVVAHIIGSLRAGLQNAQSGSNGAEVYMDDIGIWLDTYPTAPAPSPKPCGTSTAVDAWVGL